MGGLKLTTIYSYRPIIRIMIDKYLKHQMTEQEIADYVTGMINGPHCQEFIQNVMSHFMTKGIWFFQSILSVFHIFN